MEMQWQKKLYSCFAGAGAMAADVTLRETTESVKGGDGNGVEGDERNGIRCSVEGDDGLKGSNGLEGGNGVKGGDGDIVIMRYFWRID